MVDITKKAYDAIEKYNTNATQRGYLLDECKCTKVAECCAIIDSLRNDMEISEADVFIDKTSNAISISFIAPCVTVTTEEEAIIYNAIQSSDRIVVRNKDKSNVSIVFEFNNVWVVNSIE